MKYRHWREMVEIIGVISIVAAILLLAWEVKQTNQIAGEIANAEMEMRLSLLYNEIHQARATDADFAKLFPKLENPEKHLLTATDLSQIRGLTWHYINIYWAAQTAYDNGLLDEDRLNARKADVSRTLDNYPALRAHFIDIYKTQPFLQGKEMFGPIAEIVSAKDAESAD